MSAKPDVIILGAGIGGLTAALSLHAAGIRCRVFEATAQIRPLGVGINVLPHAVKELEDSLKRRVKYLETGEQSGFSDDDL